MKKIILNEVDKKEIINQREKVIVENFEKIFEAIKRKDETDTMSVLISKLLHSRIQVHAFHWQTKSKSSFAQHMALGGFYEEIGDLTDGLVESYQGKNEIITGYESSKLEDYKNVEQLIAYFKNLDAEIEKDRKNIKESYIQNQIDTIQELIYSTLYKLRFLE
jgi:DNA-binding ferritin-like protein